MPQPVKKSIAGKPHLIGLVVLSAVMLGLLLATRHAGSSPIPHLGYGFNVAAWDVSLIQSMGFNWMKVFGPPASREPVNVLLRVQASAADMGDLAAFGNQMRQLAQGSGGYIEAYEIGNEPNLDAAYGWGAPPIAADYAALLCVAFSNIKQVDPTAIVVSAGLAPTGRVTGNWNGHAGHNGLYQDEREFLGEFLDAGGANCLDALGYHPYGFSADFDAPPDIGSADPTQNCTNGFCFRGVEKIHEIMQLRGFGDKKIWATEYGWLVDPPPECLTDPGWGGRLWQIVSEEKQASNLAGSIQYADANWPWMGGMFIFNLNFNAPGAYPLCEQMRYYAVEDRPAEAALATLPKYPAALGPSLHLEPASQLWYVDMDQQPLTTTLAIFLTNGGWATLNYTVTVDPAADVVPVLPTPSGTVPPTTQSAVLMTVTTNRPPGQYEGLVTVQGGPGTIGSPATAQLTLRVVEELYRSYMPAVAGSQ